MRFFFLRLLRSKFGGLIIRFESVEPTLTDLASDRNDAFTSAPIAQRYEPLTLQDEDGVVVLLHGSISLLRMRENGFSMQVCTFSPVFILLSFLFINDDGKSAQIQAKAYSCAERPFSHDSNLLL
jgi:hypothetical protein